MELLMKKEIVFHIVIVVLIMMISGCETSISKLESEKINGAVITVKHIQSNDDKEFLEIALSNVPNLLFNTSLPDASGRIYLTSYNYFCSSIFGWNDFTMDVSASGTLIENGGRTLLHINSPIEVIGISSGKIRYNEERLIDDSALRTLNNRYERILALSEWMHTQSDVPLFNDEKDFENYWKPLIFPELVSARKRPSSWKKENAEWNRADDINWNVSYTENLFPEDLHVYRNSGGLLRDWEEALSWIYVEYHWNDVCNQLSDAILFAK
jgi:hypothetical protein